ncbi:MAG: hypothetical protein ACL93V_08415 [Candidatus Electrothrix sp. YB6]
MPISATENDTLKQIILSKQALKKELADKNTALKRAKTEDEQETARGKIQELNARIQALDSDFESIVSGVDPAQFSVTTESVDWQKEVQELLSPILDEMKKMTARPRELEALRKQVAVYEKRIALTENAVKNIQQYLEAADSDPVKQELKALLTSWQQRHDELKSRLAAVQQQLTEREQTKVSVLDSIQAVFREFFKSRGMNLALAFLAFFVVFLLMRYTHRLAHRKTRLGRLGEHRSFFLRLAVIIYYLLTFLIAAAAFILVLYLSGDWVLLGLAFLFFFGIAWTGKQTLPRFWEQAKILLNLSTVREGERVVYQGLPWRVMALNLYTRLHNPDLRGGMLRLPLSSLIGLQSRPFYVDEPWFPTKTGDLVELADGAIGTISLQTPEQVVLDTRGGCLKTYPTQTFIGLNPINYSTNTFAVFANFGIDYDCQSEVTRTIPKFLYDYIAEALKQKEYGPDLIDLLVEFKEAAASSLNILIFMKFPGSQASNYFAISRFLQRTAVDACTQYGWGIPFTQITLHQAAPADQAPEQKTTVSD